MQTGGRGGDLSSPPSGAGRFPGSGKCLCRPPNAKSPSCASCRGVDFAPKRHPAHGRLYAGVVKGPPGCATCKMQGATCTFCIARAKSPRAACISALPARKSPRGACKTALRSAPVRKGVPGAACLEFGIARAQEARLSFWKAPVALRAARLADAPARRVKPTSFQTPPSEIDLFPNRSVKLPPRCAIKSWPAGRSSTGAVLS